MKPSALREFERELSRLSEKFSVSNEDLVREWLAVEEELSIPLSAFGTKKLGSLELITRYLRENLGMSFKELGEALNRDPVSLSSTYRKAVAKYDSPVEVSGGISIPLRVVADRKLSVLESLVKWLKDEAGLSYSEIAGALARDDRTVWTAYKRAVEKLER